MKKLLNFVLIGVFCSSLALTQSYSEYLEKAKKYESQKKWCYALGAYYDAMGTDELPENKYEAWEGYHNLCQAIESGNPGLGKFNLFTIHDEWKKLLIDAEKYGSSFSKYELTVGELVQGDLDYTTKTASYSAKIIYKISDRYKHTIEVIKTGYSFAYKDDWNDIPSQWPKYSVSSNKNDVYNVNGALIYARDIRAYYDTETLYLNAFEVLEIDKWQYKTPGLFDYKFNIVDENGKELVKGKRWLIGESDNITISGITPEVMDLIDNGKAFINPTNCYLQYGKFNPNDNKGGRTFIKNFPETQIPMEKVPIICWNNKEDKGVKNRDVLEIRMVIKNMVEIPGKNIKMLKTEVTKELYKAVMENSPFYEESYRYKEGIHEPVEVRKWDYAIEFCYRLNSLNQLNQENGFRLPTVEEWQYAAKGGENYIYAGSNDLDEVGWYEENWKNQYHVVAQKKPNGYGLFDMSGNASEMCMDESNHYNDKDHYKCGGDCTDPADFCKVSSSVNYIGYEAGFRIVCAINEEE